MQFKGILCAVVMAGLAFFVPAKTWADDCDSKIVDAAGELTPEDLVAVNAAAQNLGNLGADVRIRTVMDHGGRPSLVAFEDDLCRRCRSWQGTDGLTKNNLAVIIFSYGTKRGAGLYNGQAFVMVIDRVAGLLRATPVAPLTAAASDVLVERLVSQPTSNTPPVANPSPASNETPVPNATRPFSGSSPKGLNGLWITIAILGLTTIGALVFLVSRARNRAQERLREQERRDAAQHAADAVKVRCANRINDFDSGTKLALIESRVATAAEEACEGDAQSLREAYVVLKALLDATKVAFANLQRAESGSSRDGHAAEAYDRAKRSYQQLLERLDAFEQGISALDEQIVALKRLAGEVHVEITAAREAIVKADADRAKICDQQYRITDSDTRMSEAKTSLAAAETAQTEKRFAAAKASAEQAKAQAEDAAKLAAAMPVRRQAALDAAAEQKARIAKINAGISEARVVSSRIKAEYAKTCWDTVSDNVDTAVTEVDSATKAIEDALRQAGMEQQKWEDAETSVGLALASLDRAELLVASVSTLKANLESAKRGVTGEITSAHKGLKDARGFIQKHDDGSRETLAANLDQIEAELNGLSAELDAVMPDYLEISEKIERAHAKIDKIFGEARAERAAMERKRQQAESETRNAGSAILIAEEYVRKHAGDVGGAASRKLASARRALENARETLDLDGIIRCAGESKALAKAALDAAKEAVQRAEAERAAERARIEPPPYGKGGSNGRGSLISFDSDPSPPSSGLSDNGGGSTDW